MSLLLKDPLAVLDYEVDWSAAYLVGESVSDSRWDIFPEEEGGVALVGQSVADGIARAMVSSGIVGRLYRLTNHITTSAGRIDSRSVMIRVEAR